jgi:hypothetical protein
VEYNIKINIMLVVNVISSEVKLSHRSDTTFAGIKYGFLINYLYIYIYTVYIFVCLCCSFLYCMYSPYGPWFIHTHTHTHTYIYIYIYIYTCAICGR